jgi:hypothetical protein
MGMLTYYRRSRLSKMQVINLSNFLTRSDDVDRAELDVFNKFCRIDDVPELDNELFLLKLSSIICAISGVSSVVVSDWLLIFDGIVGVSAKSDICKRKRNFISHVFRSLIIIIVIIYLYESPESLDE